MIVSVTHLSTGRTDPSNLTETCPRCGSFLQAWPALDGSGYLAMCPNCPDLPPVRLTGRPPLGAETRPTRRFEFPSQPAAPPPAEAASPPGAPTPEAPPPEQAAAPDKGSSRFRDLTRAGQTPPAELPPSLLEDLPPDARKALTGPLKQKPPDPKPVDESDERRQAQERLTGPLRQAGYVITEDSHGVRLSGHLRTGAGGTGRLSASDVVRLAADLDGGVLPPEQRSRCPRCDAVIAAGSARCPWCGATLDESPPAPA